MNRYTLIFMLLLAMPIVASGQRLVYKEKVPQIVTTSTIVGKEPIKGAPTYIDFFVLNSPQNDKEIAALQKIAKKFKNKVNFVVLTKEDKAKVKEYFKNKEINFAVMHDKDGETFKNLGVKFVPFAVYIDKKNNFIWQGKNTTITDDIIIQAL